MSVESIKGDIIKELLEQLGAGNSRLSLESFGFFLDDYVIEGGVATISTTNRHKVEITEMIVSFADALYRVKADLFYANARNCTYFLDFTARGLVFNLSHPNSTYLPLWQVNTDATGGIVSLVDMRGPMGYVRFRSEILGIIQDDIYVDESHIIPDSVSTTKIQNLAVKEPKLADDSVSTRTIQDQAVQAVHLANESVSSRTVQEKSIQAPHLADASVLNRALAPEVATRIDTAESRLDEQEILIDALQTGDSGPAANAARVSTPKGITYNTLKDRVDATDADVIALQAYTSQEDFIATLQRHMTYKGQFNILPNNVTDAFNVSVLYDIGNGKAVSYTFFKQANIDNFLMLGIGRYGNLVTNQNLFAQRNFDSKTGTWVEVTTYYTTQVGATMTISFYGSQLVFHHHVDDRGGYWRFIVDGDTANPIDISTWAATVGDTDSTIFTKSTNANHTVVATFVGDDPAHLPSGGAGTSRGWANYIDGQYTFKTYIYATTNSAIVETMVGGSNKEFAFQIRKSGTSEPYYFVPYHTAMTAYKAADPIFLVDGVPTTLTAGLAINGVKDLKIIQSIYGRVPEHPGENLIKVSLITTFASDGTVSWDGKMEVLVGVDVALGYVDMLPMNPSFAKKLLTGFENKYPTLVSDGSITVLEDEADLCVSYLALNDSIYKNVGVVMRINNPRQSLRQGQSGRGNTFIHHRVDNNQKFYPQIYNNAHLPAGYVHRFSGDIYIAVFDGLYDLF